MGMAASQARLLTITARLADNELRSQTINNAKMRLATQSSQASENYINALNNATYKFTNYDMEGGLVNQPLTFNALTAYSPYNTQYGLVNSAGQLLVSETEARLFAEADGNIDKYLESHGLKYDTTYFDTNFKEPLVNRAYPGNLFDPNAAADGGLTLTGDMLKKFFEEYNSYENSMEVDEYYKSYLQFTNTDKEIKKYGKTLMKQFLTSTTRGTAPSVITTTNPLTTGSSGYTIALTGDVSAAKQMLLGAFTNSTNPYCLEDLKNKGFISGTTEAECLSILNSISTTGNMLNVDDKMDVVADGDNYILGELKIVKGSDGKYTIDHSALVDDPGTVTYTWTAPADGTSYSDYRTAIKNIRYTATYKDGSSDVPISYEYYYNDATEQAGRKFSTNNTKIIESEFQKVLNNVIETILSNTDYTTFCKAVSNNRTNEYGITVDPNSEIGQLLENYATFAKEYIDLIFEDAYDAVMDDIKNAVEIPMLDEEGNQLYDDPPENTLETKVKVTMDELQDIEFVLQYMREKGYTPAHTFLTVIKDYLIDEVIDEYGTPKYAWIDENDASNTQNADAKAQWYTNLFKRMQKGYKALENGLASSKEWIEYALESGTVYMEQVDASFAWNALDYKTCSRIIEETDDTAVARAEAEYNRAMNDIKAKDSIYDLELKNIDTEHNALQTEYDVIKGVISKNIERNFKFNQSA